MRLSYRNIVVLLLVLMCSSLLVSAQENYFDKYNNQHYMSKVVNFSFISIDNDTLRSLYSIDADTIMILFYDPDCDHCKDEIKRLKKDKSLKHKIEKGEILVMTVPPDVEKSYWQKTAKHLPSAWLNAYTEDKDILTTKYLWKVPEMFILDRGKRVIRIDMFEEDVNEE